jgi:hypothetical protein
MKRDLSLIMTWHIFHMCGLGFGQKGSRLDSVCVVCVVHAPLPSFSPFHSVLTVPM